VGLTYVRNIPTDAKPSRRRARSTSRKRETVGGAADGHCGRARGPSREREFLPPPGLLPFAFFSLSSRTQDQRATALTRLATAKKTLTGLQAELEAYGACDPVKVEEKRRAVMLAREAALRHTDNYAILMTYFTRQHNVEPQDIRAYLGVGVDYEELC